MAFIVTISYTCFPSCSHVCYLGESYEHGPYDSLRRAERALSELYLWELSSLKRDPKAEIVRVKYTGKSFSIKYFYKNYTCYIDATIREVSE